jgi:hypothetical protein
MLGLKQAMMLGAIDVEVAEFDEGVIFLTGC